jgi:hypothetical protein
MCQAGQFIHGGSLSFFIALAQPGKAVKAGGKICSIRRGGFRCSNFFSGYLRLQMFVYMTNRQILSASQPDSSAQGQIESGSAVFKETRSA